MKYIALVLFALFVCIDEKAFAVDDGGRCSICGKLTMRGSSHVCTPKKKRNSSSVYVSRGSSSTSKGNGESSSQDIPAKDEVKQSTLPKFYDSITSHEVLGVVIDPEKEKPQLLCRNSSSYSSSECSFDIGGYPETASAYYKKYCALIPVLGVRGMKPNEKIEDETLSAAVEQLKVARAEARVKLKAEREAEKKNFQEYHTPLKCLAAQDSRVDESELLRKWRNKKGTVLEGVWIANYKAYNVDGIIILTKGKKRLTKVPVSVLCDEDVAYIRKTNMESDVPRFGFVSLSVADGSSVAERFKRAGVTNMQMEAVVFADGQSEDGENVTYIQLYPAGQICEWPMGDSTRQDNPSSRNDYVSRSSRRRRGVAFGDDSSNTNTISAEDAAKGPVYILERKMADAVKAKAAAAVAAAEEEAAEEAARVEREKRESIAKLEKARQDAIREKERPFREAYSVLDARLTAASMKMNSTNPEKHCDIHKWKERYAPKFKGDLYTEQQKNDYASNYMKALELMDKGLLKCTCNDSFYKVQFEAATKEWQELFKKIQALKEAHPEIDF